MFENVEEALEALEQCKAGARDAFDGKSEEPWEWSPECVDGDPIWYEWCDDCETFHTGWYLFGYEIVKGCVEIVVWDVDQDGNWDVAEGACVGTPEAKSLELTYGHTAWEVSYARYLRHVAETGEDPCDEFIMPNPIRKDEQWEIHVIERGEKVWVTKAGMLGGETYEERPDRLPDYVQEFLLLEKLGDVSACAIDPQNVKTVADLGEDVKWQGGPHRDTWVTTVKIPHYYPALSDEEWSAVLREKANKARAKLTFKVS